MNTAPDKSDACYYETVNETANRERVWRKPKRVLGIHGAPRKKRGATEMVYSHFIDGMKEAGAEVETVYLAEGEPNSCLGCFKCWTRDSGQCHIQDNISEVVKKIPEYDLMIFATPLYGDGMSGLLKNFIDRLMPLIHPSIFLKEGRCLHPCRYSNMPNLSLVSVCGFYEVENFEPLVQHISAVSMNMHMPLIATVLRPETLSLMDRNSERPMNQVKIALKEAGEMVIHGGRIAESIRQRISQPILSKKDYLENAGEWWKTNNLLLKKEDAKCKK